MGKGDWHNGPWGQPPHGGGGSQPPSGGEMPPSGPDFEDWMKKSQEKFHQLFPGGGESKKGFVLIFLIVFLIWMASGIYFVKPEEQGVVVRLGKYHRTTENGPHYHWPYPFETVLIPRVTTVNELQVGTRSGVSGGLLSSDSSVPAESLMLTGDENIVEINFKVQWKVDNAPDYLFNIRNPDGTVKDVAESAMREIIGKTKIATVLAAGKFEVEDSTRKLMQEMLNHYGAGIEVVKVNLLKADPPSQVIDAFRDVQTARIDMETARNEADAYRNDIVPKARGRAEKMVLDAEAYKQEVIARAKGEAARFTAVYEEYKQAKDVTKRRMYLETMENILQNMNKIIIEGKGSQGVLPYLPLPELKTRNSTESNG